MNEGSRLFPHYCILRAEVRLKLRLWYKTVVELFVQVILFLFSPFQLQVQFADNISLEQHINY